MVKIGNALRNEIEKAAAFPGQVVFKRTVRPLAAKVVAEQPKKLSAIQRFLISQSGGIKTAAGQPGMFQRTMQGISKTMGSFRGPARRDRPGLNPLTSIKNMRNDPFAQNF